MKKKINNDDFVKLKNRIKAEIKRRNGTGNISANESKIVFSTEPEKNKIIDKNHINTTIEGIGYINPNKSTIKSNGKIIDDLTVVDATLTLFESTPRANRGTSDCKSSCTGMCVTTCSTTCTGCTGCTGCGGACSNTCTGCTDSCSGCGGACSNNCTGCTDSCTGCAHYCTGCGEGCADWCLDACNLNCSIDCYSCAFACYSTCASGCVNTCKTNVNFK